MDNDKSMIERRMEALMYIIDASIVNLTDRNDRLMLACAMMQRTAEIFDDLLGEENRKKMFKEWE